MPGPRNQRGTAPARPLRRLLSTGLKVALSAGILFFLARKIGSRRLLEAWAHLDPIWLLPAFALQAAGIFSSILRWRWLLRGQDLDVPLRHLVGSFLVGRFFGIVAPGPVGLDAYRAYDIAKHAKAPAKSIAVILVEKVIGFFALGLLVLATLSGGRHVVGDRTLLGVGLVFILPVSLALYILIRPGAVERMNARLMPRAFGLRDKVGKAAAAAGAYAERKGTLATATGFGILVHVCTASLYIFLARAVGVHVTVAEMLFAAPLMIVATTVPISFSGFGMRELTLVALLGTMAVPEAQAVLMGNLGFVVSESWSLLGGLVFLLRGRAYAPQIAELRAGARAADLVDDDDEALALPDPEAS